MKFSIIKTQFNNKKCEILNKKNFMNEVYIETIIIFLIEIAFYIIFR